MNRVHKFRFWLGHTKKMTYGHTLAEIPKIIPEFTDDIIPLQFTGLYDKEGKEIYEKDCDDDGSMIDWCERCCGYQFFQIDVPTKDIIFCHNCEGNFMVQDHIPDFKISGNLYEI